MPTKREASRSGGLYALLYIGLPYLLIGCADDGVLSSAANGSSATTTTDASTTSGSSDKESATPGSSSSAAGKSAGKPNGSKGANTGRPDDASDGDDAGMQDTPPPTPTMTHEEGEACARDKDCQSGHCSNAICCSGGECCNDVTDCTVVDSGEALECHKPKSCQGRRGLSTCRMHVCGVADPVNDDTACGGDVVAADCGFYADVRCTGEPDQDVPACATRCDSNRDCDAAAYCERNRCVADHAPNSDCDNNAQCASDSCFQGKCCASGVCCEEASDCPASYTKGATCDDANHCQGTRGEARCREGRCETETTDDDSACGWLTPSKLCGQSRRLTCQGGPDQDAPSCGDGTCFEDFQCDNDKHCGADGRCVDDVPNGERCDRDALCESNHCNSGLCCEGGVCCRDGDSCEDSARCVEPTACQGESYVNECMNFQCTPVETREDDRACWGALVDRCGSFADLRCSGESDQDVSERMCPRYCRGSFECDAGLECRGGYCYAPEPPPNQPPPNKGGRR